MHNIYTYIYNIHTCAVYVLNQIFCDIHPILSSMFLLQTRFSRFMEIESDKSKNKQIS